MNDEDAKNKPNFVLVDQPNIPGFITGKKREKLLKAFEEESIRKIDPSRDENYKVQFFEFWKKNREREGRPLTPKEEKYYKSLRDDHKLTETFVVFLPMAIFLTLRREIGEFNALLVSLGVGAFMKWLFSL